VKEAMAVPTKAELTLVPRVFPTEEQFLACVRSAYDLGTSTMRLGWVLWRKADKRRLLFILTGVETSVRDFEKYCGIDLPESHKYLADIRQKIEKENLRMAIRKLLEFGEYLSDKIPSPYLLEELKG
jgi:hypothetical protein